ncbi:transmembrane protein 141 isoform X4 [Serinus canaria]|uniref:transmembrane protein 141 isoform X4 n=1 Tax=Serinus canaria TaxID=9135 RepID=UPI0021CCE686|nr:transmembrane protein 141 isoform X4 [Serinus canaria]
MMWPPSTRYGPVQPPRHPPGCSWPLPRGSGDVPAMSGNRGLGLGRQRGCLRGAEDGAAEAAIQPAVEPAVGCRSTSAAPATGSLGSYVVTRAETQKCSNFWIYLETGKSPQELAVTGGVSQPTENLLSAEDGDGAATLVRKNRYGDVVD